MSGSKLEILYSSHKKLNQNLLLPTPHPSPTSSRLQKGSDKAGSAVGFKRKHVSSNVCNQFTAVKGSFKTVKVSCVTAPYIGRNAV